MKFCIHSGYTFALRISTLFCGLNFFLGQVWYETIPSEKINVTMRATDNQLLCKTMQRELKRLTSTLNIKIKTAKVDIQSYQQNLPLSCLFHNQSCHHSVLGTDPLSLVFTGAMQNLVPWKSCSKTIALWYLSSTTIS